jgi:hypothetical protein
MNDAPEPSDDALTQGMDALHVLICRAQRDLFLLIAEADRRKLWQGDGARDMAHWLWMRFGVSDWKARRWIGASHALESLPSTADAFVAGRVGIDKVVELCRYVTPDSEQDALPWAERVSAGAIRRKADVLREREVREAADVDSARSLRWWSFDEGRRFRASGRATGGRRGRHGPRPRARRRTGSGHAWRGGRGVVPGATRRCAGGTGVVASVG